MSKLFCVLGIIAGAVLIIFSFYVDVPKVVASNVNVPNREIKNPSRYVGRDAYNYQIEASILGGEIAGANSAKSGEIITGAIYYVGKMIARTMYLVGGILLLFGSLIVLGVLIKSKQQQI